MLPSKCRPKYWSEIKEMENQYGLYFHKWTELKNQINDLDDLQFPKDIIVNFVNKWYLYIENNIEDPEDPFQVAQYIKERLGHESNLEEEDIYEAISTITAHVIFQKDCQIWSSSKSWYRE